MIKCGKDKKRSSMNDTEDSEKRSVILVNVHVFNIGIICIHGREFPEQLAFHQEFKRSHNETNVRWTRTLLLWHSKMHRLENRPKSIPHWLIWVEIPIVCMCMSTPLKGT